LSQQKSGRGAKPAKPAKPVKPAPAGRSSASRAIPTRAATAAAARGGRGVYVQAPRSDVYVTLLGVALGSIVLGVIFLALVLNGYEWNLSANG